MKSLRILFLLSFAFIATNSFAQTTTENIWVAGLCDMCKDRIEKAMDTKGVKFANYDVKTNQLEIAYNASKITSEEIHAKLNAAGHDTKKSKATDESYANLHECCKYRENESCPDEKKADACCDKDKKDSCEKKEKDDDKDEH